MGKQKTFTETASLTNMGITRSNNEDSLFTIDKYMDGKSKYSSFGIYIVADGLGGHQGGEIASEIATRVVSTTLLNRLTGITFNNPFLLVKEAIEKANKQIFEIAGTKQELRSMGTTITMGLRLDNELYIGHVGDSRAYLIKGQEIKQLTVDHSLIAQLLKEGTITPEEARTHPDRGRILRCLGMSGKVKVDSYYQDGKETKLILENKDSLLFCSDGLTNHVADTEILACIAKNKTALKVCNNLVDLANARGGEDNISVIFVSVNSK